VTPEETYQTKHNTFLQDAMRRRMAGKAVSVCCSNCKHALKNNTPWCTQFVDVDDAPSPCPFFKLGWNQWREAMEDHDID